MKKLIGTAMLAALLATSAFAEINIGAGYNHGVWTPFIFEKAEGSDADIKMSVGSPWGGGVRTGISFAGAGENIGFVFDIKGDGGQIGVNDNTYVWAKPWNWMEIRAGNWFGDTLKSAQSYGIRGSKRIGLGGNETTTFARISDNKAGHYDAPMSGALLALTPIEGLFIGAGFDISSLANPSVKKKKVTVEGKDSTDEFVNEYDEGGYTASKKIADVFKDTQYAVGYTIEDLMAIKVQYMGGSTAGIFAPNASNDPDNLGTINVGVDLLMLEGMKIGIGAFIPLEDDTTVSFAATLDGGFDALAVNAYVGAEIQRAETGSNGFEAGVGLGYDLGNGLGVNGDVRYRIDLPKKSGDAQNELTAGLFLSKGMSNGSISLGVEGDFMFGPKDEITLAVPLSIQCGF